MKTRIGAALAAAMVFACVSWCGADVVLRCVSYNITGAGGSPRAGLDTILQAIGNESVAGRSLPVDLVAIQEVGSQTTTTQDVVVMLNAIYGPGVYARGALNGATTGAGTQGVVFNTQKLQLIGELAVGTAGTSSQPRQTLRHRFRTVGAPASSDFYVYNGHWKASDDSTSEGRRRIEAMAIRADADALGANVGIIYVGDFNLYRSTDQAFQHMLTPGFAQAFDPIGRAGAWHDNASFIDIATQAPAVSPGSGLTGGGLDDRFDWHMVSGVVMTTPAAGLSYLAGSYHTFGNNGSVPINGNINDGSSTALPGLPNRVTVLNLLTTVTDHLPVVADYVVLIQGACCNGPACTFVSDQACAGAWSSGSCSPSPCAEATGACCAATGCCTASTQAACAGSWISGAGCAPNPCSAPPGACCAADGSCAMTTQCACAQIWTGGSCTPNPCPQPTGACCRGTACTIESSAACAGSGAGSFRGVGTACGTPGNPTTCCRANFNGQSGISVQDLFDFLAAYFANATGADFNQSGLVSVQDIFDFLAAYFAGCS
ncbi:MAG: hypothetical protein IT438_13965 [Phycisphaerales bacterium]|nr:hypothetical protein [Phycisphaerales bacterium]